MATRRRFVDRSRETRRETRRETHETRDARYEGMRKHETRGVGRKTRDFIDVEPWLPASEEQNRCLAL